MSVLTTVRKVFPGVKKVIDAKEPVVVSVSKTDSRTGRKKDGANCALAKACVRQKIADGAIIGLTTTYLVHGDVATRYLNAETVSREITSFDRHHDFSPGKNYRLSPPPPTRRIGVRTHKSESGGEKTGTNGPRVARVHHRTAFVRKMKDQ